ncbi:phytanoyl-CoA dioxygenase family protein [Lentzea alba]|uniref:phytanoyl-CoA dioxygenase family protein n=1 Tax=Lentzea alba TaxID=2714351 RepID=UPI0039BF96B3
MSHFNAFGFVVLRGLLSKDEVAQLREESVASLTGAYGVGALDENGDMASVPAYVVPTMNDNTPLSSSLVADDPRFWQASHHFMGGPTVPTNSEATGYWANSRWHSDMNADVQGVKFMVYLDACTPETGRLQVMPGSHLRAPWTAFWDHVSQDPHRQGLSVDSREWSIPSYDIDTEPGDVIVFHSNLLHASAGGQLRLSWDTSYFLYPAMSGTERGEMIRDAVLYTGDYGHHPYDHEKWTTWRDWVASADTDPRRTAIRRLEVLGVLGVEGADIGAPKWQPTLTNPFPLVSGAPYKPRSSK